MHLPDEKYQPVSCDAHDLLEALATRRDVVDVEFLDEANEVRSRLATITDVYARQGEEYLVIGTGEAIRLDRIIAVDGAAFMAHDAGCACPAPSVACEVMP